MIMFLMNLMNYHVFNEPNEPYPNLTLILPQSHANLTPILPQSYPNLTLILLSYPTFLFRFILIISSLSPSLFSFYHRGSLEFSFGTWTTNQSI